MPATSARPEKPCSLLGYFVVISELTDSDQYIQRRQITYAIKVAPGKRVARNFLVDQASENGPVLYSPNGKIP